MELRPGQIWEHDETGNRITIESVDQLKINGTLSHKDFPAETEALGVPFIAFSVMTLIHDPKRVPQA